MVELLLPVARRLTVNADAIPMSMRGMLTGVLRNKNDINEMAYQVGGRDVKPKKPLMIVGPDERTVMLIVGDGVAEAAELEELAHAGLERQEKNVKKHGRAFDFASARDRAGLPQANEFDQNYRDALRRRAAAHKRNPFSDPARVPQRPPAENGRKIYA
ncbi:hypothetical protein LCGC14_0815360 [marine sediment metagenome]|uniref:Uncharacterized protein n=1 Tax=marine sediment metagenome TaxID=412755 RepID=A0A0F9PQ33_9ZZZZ